MDTSGFDTVARHIPLYRERLLALPGWVKDQAFDIHIASGQPLSLSGKEGALFLGKKGVTRAFQEGIVTTPQQLRELFLAACGHSVFRHEEELRQGYVRLGENLRVGVCGTAVAEGGQVRSLRDITALVYRIPRQVPGCGDRLFLEGVPLERGVLVVGPPSSGKTTFLRDVARSLSLGRFGPSRRVAVVDERGELVGEALRLMDVAAVERLDQLAHRRGGDVRDHRDDTHGADRQERQEQAIITRIPGEAGALLLFDGGGEVAGRVLDGFDMLKLGKTVICFDADFQSGTAGHVIYDDRPLGHGIDGLVMADHAVLAGARVVRHNHEHRVGSRLLRLLDHAHGVRGIVRAGTGDHRDVHDFLDGPHQLDLLLHVGHGGFAGRAVHHQPVGAVGDQLLRQRLRGLEINGTIGLHGGDHGRKNTSERSRIKKMHSTVSHSANGTSRHGRRSARVRDHIAI